MWFWVLAFFVLAVFYTIVTEWKARNCPPGPRGLRVLPSLLRLIRDGTVQFSHYILNKYGDIAFVQLPTANMVMLGSHQLLKEAFSKPEISDRIAGLEVGGLVTANGRVWKEHRRFALSKLRDFGMGKSGMESRILEECSDLLNELGKQKGAFDPRYCIGCATTNVICAVIFSERFSYEDETLKKLWNMINENVTSAQRQIVRLVPLLESVPSIKANQRRIRENAKAVANLVIKYTEQHKETYQENHIRDYIDAYITEMKQQAEEEDTTFTQHQLIRSVQDLFLAGSETTSTSLRWSLALMGLHDDVQEKVYDEIVEVVGKERQVAMSDKVKMPYTEAVINEVQRVASITPMIVHKSISDTEVAGYFIPQGSIVTVNQQKLNQDPRVWPYPDEFNVANFYKNGEVINRQHVVTFSLGKRSCLGESLAKMEMFLFFVSLIQRYRFYFDMDETPDLTDAMTGLIRMPKPFKIRFEARD